MLKHSLILESIVKDHWGWLQYQIMLHDAPYTFILTLLIIVLERSLKLESIAKDFKKIPVPFKVPLDSDIEF